jgi:hypothetical protein
VSSSTASVRQALLAAAPSARDIQALAEALRGHPDVEAVQVGDHLIKTAPPKQTLSIGVKPVGGSGCTLMATLVLRPDGSLELADVQELAE